MAMGFDDNTLAQLMAAIRAGGGPAYNQSAPGLLNGISPTLEGNPQTAPQPIQVPVQEPMTAAPVTPSAAPEKSWLSRIGDFFAGGEAQAQTPPGMLPGTGNPYIDQRGADLASRRDQNKWLIPAMALAQYGAAMQVPREQRPAILAQIPTTILAAIKAQRDDVAVNKLLEVQAKYYGAQGKNISMDQLAAKMYQEGNVEGARKLLQMNQEKKAEVVKNPFIKSVQEGDEMVTYEINPVTGEQREIGRGPKWDKNKAAAVEVKIMPDGTIISGGGTGTGKGGGGSVGTGLTQQGAKDVEKGLLDVTEGLSDTHRIAQTFKPEFATISGQWEGFKSRYKDKLGYELNPDETKKLEGFTSYRAEAGRVFANTLKKLSGTAVTEPEMKRQEVYLINPGTGVFDGDSPSQVKTKLERFVSFQRQAIARLNYMRKNGLSIRNAAGDVDFGKIEIEKMPGIIKGYGQALSTKLAKENNWRTDDPRLIKAVQEQTAEHFGLVY